MAKDMMLDLMRGIEEGMDAPAHKVPVMAAEDDDQGDLVLDELLRVHHQIEGGTVAGKMNPAGQKNWGPPYWLLVAATSVIVLAPTITKDLMFPPELAMFAVLQCAICLILRAMKQMV